MSELLDKHKKLLMEAKQLERSNPKKGALLAEQVRIFAKEHNHSVLEAEALLRMGRCSYLKGDLEVASNRLNDGLLMLDGLGAKELECEMNLSMGNTYLFMQIHDQAMTYFVKALDISKQENFVHLEAGILNNMAALFADLDNIEDSLKYLEMAMERKSERIDSFLELSFTYNLAELYYRNRQINEARNQIDQAMERINEEEDRLLYAKALHILGLIEYEEGKKASGLIHMEKALEISLGTKEFLMEIEIRMDLAAARVKEKEMDEGIRILLKGIERNTKSEFDNAMLMIYRRLAEYYDLIEEQGEANYYYRKHLLALEIIEKEKKQERVRGIKLHVKIKQYQDETQLYKNLSSRLQEKTKLLSDSYEQMEIVSDIGQKITAKLDIENIFDDLYKDMGRLMKINTLGIGIYNETTRSIKYGLYIEDGEKMPVHSIDLSNTNSLATYTINQDKELIINDLDKEYKQYINQRRSSVGRPSKSLVFIPLKVEEKLIGILTVQSREKNSYSNKNLLALHTMASYIAIAINNAQKSKSLREEIHSRKTAQKNLELLNNKLQVLSDRDGLTKVGNRRYLDYQLEIDWKKSLEDQNSISLMLLDIDYFKEYNDFYGHLKGDEVLIKIAEILTRTLGKETLDSTVARYGGDEFIVVLPGRNLKDGERIAKRIILEVRKEYMQHEKSPISNVVTVSIGIAMNIPNNMDYTVLLNKADQALYKAKRIGRNCVGLME